MLLLCLLIYNLSVKTVIPKIMGFFHYKLNILPGLKIIEIETPFGYTTGETMAKEIMKRENLKKCRLMIVHMQTKKTFRSDDKIFCNTAVIAYRVPM